MSFKKEGLQTNLVRIQTTIKDYVDSVKTYVQDKAEPLDDRWEVFCEVGKTGILPEVYTHNIEGKLRGFSEEISWYDDFYMNCGQSRSAQSLMESVLNKDDVDEEEFMESILDLFVYTVMEDD